VLLWPSAAIRLALNVARLATSLINKFCISMRAKFFAGHARAQLPKSPDAFGPKVSNKRCVNQSVNLCPKKSKKNPLKLHWLLGNLHKNFACQRRIHIKKSNV